MTTQGGAANRSGQAAERVVACVLDAFHCSAQVGIGRSIYGHPLTVDFVVNGVPGFPLGLAVEVKRQGVSGSVDEKIPYVIANIKEAFSIPGILVLDGPGMKPGCRRWAKRQEGGNLVAVLDVVELSAWIARQVL